MRILIFISLFLILTPSYLLAGDGTFLDQAKVSKNYICLGDIVTFTENDETTKSLATQRIASSPAPGKTVILDTHTILRQLASQHLLPSDIRWKGAAEVSVSRQGITITADKVSQIIDQFLQTKLQDFPNGEIRFTPKSLPLPFTLAAGEVSWSVIPSKPSIIGSSRFSIIFKVDGRVSKNISIKGDLEALIPVAVAKKSIQPNEPFSQANYKFEVRDIADVKDAVFNTKQLLGKQTSRSIKAGNIIRASHLESIPLVYRGEQVKVLLRSGGLQLTTKGIARSDGGLNDVIRVQNTTSNKTFYCQVAAPGLVEVKL